MGGVAAMIRFIGLAFLILTMTYVVVGLYQRERHRWRLRSRWNTGPQKVSRADFMQRGMRAYDNSWRRYLLLGIYIVPLSVVGILIYVMNYM